MNSIRAKSKSRATLTPRNSNYRRASTREAAVGSFAEKVKNYLTCFHYLNTHFFFTFWTLMAIHEKKKRYPTFAIIYKCTKSNRIERNGFLHFDVDHFEYYCINLIFPPYWTVLWKHFLLPLTQTSVMQCPTIPGSKRENETFNYVKAIT